MLDFVDKSRIKMYIIVWIKRRGENKVSKQVHHKTKTSNAVLIPIILMIGFIPLIVHMYQYNANLSQFDWFSAGGDSQVDFFFGWKMIAIIVVGIVMVGVLLYQYFKKKDEFRFENSFYFLFFYGLFVVMSALFSGYKYWVVRGTYELLEPVWCVLAYILLCYYTYQYVREEKQLKRIFTVAGIGMLIVMLIGAFQYFKLDFFKSSIGKHLITNPSWWNELDSIKFNMLEGTSYTTLYNPNFLSFYFGIMIPLILGLIIATKKWWMRIFWGILEVGCLICLKGCNSDSAWMALLAGCVIVVLVLLSRKKKTLLVGVGILVIGGIGFGCLIANSSIGQSILSTIIGTYHLEENVRLDGIETDNEYAELNIDGNKLRVSYTLDDQNIQMFCKDETDAELSLELSDSDSTKYLIDDTRFEGITLQPMKYDNGMMAVDVSIDGLDWTFMKVEGKGYYYCNPAGKIVKYQSVKSADLFREDAFSLRGRIWNLTIPLLGKHILIGSGANTFMFEYPQNDYIFHRYLDPGNSYDVKAHSWYLQQCLETGLLGTIALLIFIGGYLVRSIKIYRRVDLHDSISWIGFGLFAGILAYLFAAMVNDSNVCTAPVFWGVLGLGFATNRMVVEKNALFVNQVSVDVQDGDNGQTKIMPEKPVEVKTGDLTKVQTENSNKKTASGKKQSRKQRKNQKK